MKFQTIVFSALILLLSCGQVKRSQPQEQSESMSILDTQIPELSSDTTISDSFIYAVLESDLTYPNLKTLYQLSNPQQETTVNKHSGAIDTIELYNLVEDTLKFYKAEDKVLLLRLVTTSDRFKFSEVLSVGTEAKVLEAITGQMPSKNGIVIQDIEGGHFVTFILHQNKIQRIIYQIGYLD